MTKRKKSKHYLPNMRDRIRAMLKDINGPSPSAKGAKSFREREEEHCYTKILSNLIFWGNYIF